MFIVRLLRCTLPVLLLWPLLTSPILLSVARPASRAAVTRGMACCSGSCEGCERCELAGDAAVSETPHGGAGGCELSAAPCHRPASRSVAPFAWEPFTPSEAAIVDLPAEVQRSCAIEPAAPASRTAPAPERPPAALA